MRGTRAVVSRGAAGFSLGASLAKSISFFEFWLTSRAVMKEGLWCRGHQRWMMGSLVRVFVSALLCIRHRWQGGSYELCQAAAATIGLKGCFFHPSGLLREQRWKRFCLREDLFQCWGGPGECDNKGEP